MSEEDRGVAEMLERLRFTKEELEKYKRIMAELPTDDIAKMTDEELVTFSAKIFGKEHK